MIQKVAIIGGGVIGGGWAARFLLNGLDVYVYDPDPNAEQTLLEEMHSLYLVSSQRLHEADVVQMKMV